MLHILGRPFFQTFAGFMLIALALWAGAFASLDNGLRDQRFGLSPRAATGQIVFVDIDPKSLEAVGVWPWPRSVHARVLDALMALGADDVIFDVDFSVASSEAEDAEFERALADAGGYAFLAAFQQNQSGQAVATNLPLQRFAQYAEPVAVNVAPDADGAVRTYPAGMSLDGKWVPSVAARLARSSGTAPVIIDFAIDPNSVPRISVADLLAGTVPVEMIEGRQVVVGASAVELRDLFLVPRFGVLPGALLQIIASEALKQGRALTPLGLPASLVLLAALALLGYAARRTLSLWIIVLSNVAVAGSLESVAAFLQIRNGVLLDTAAGHAGLAVLVLSALIEEVRKRGLAYARAARERDATRVILDRVVTDNFDGVVVVDADARILTASQSAVAILGVEIAGRDANDVLPAALSKAIRRCLTDGAAQPAAAEETVIERNGGQHVLEYVATYSQVPIERSTRAVVTLTFRDITRRREAEEKLRYLSIHDTLTGTLTRAALVEEMDHRLVRGQALAAIVIDLRRFRAINDTLGHGQGDFLLKQVASRLTSMGPDLVARLGGDSFAMTVPTMDAPKLAGYCDSIIQWLSFPYQLDGGHQATIAASAGATTSLISGADAETMLSHADMALSVAKESAGHSALLFDPQMDERLRDSQAMDSALREAIRERRFVLAYQPQIDLKSGRLIGAEALSRWSDPVRGAVSPMAFVAAAEETGLIVDLGRWALEAACIDAANWPLPLRIAVNVSPVQFELSDVFADVAMALDRSGLDPSRLDIEITEGVFVKNAAQVTSTLEALRSIGVGVAIDDFGTGYSSLGYLGQLPVDKIKIDQSFVRKLPADTEALAVVRALLSLSDALGKSVVAEGIETEAQESLLRDAGCEIGQGYLFGRPMSDADLAARMVTSQLAGLRLSA